MAKRTEPPSDLSPVLLAEWNHSNQVCRLAYYTDRAAARTRIGRRRARDQRYRDRRRELTRWQTSEAT